MDGADRVTQPRFPILRDQRLFSQRSAQLGEGGPDSCTKLPAEVPSQSPGVWRVTVHWTGGLCGLFFRYGGVRYLLAVILPTSLSSAKTARLSAPTWCAANYSEPLATWPAVICTHRQRASRIKQAGSSPNFSLDVLPILHLG
jgi:hypothetical protein